MVLRTNGVAVFDLFFNLLTPAVLWGWPVDRSAHGAGMDALFGWMFWTCIFVFVGVHAMLVMALVRYRRREGQPAVHSHGSTRVEIVWTAVPAVVLVGMAIASANVARTSKFTGPSSELDVQRFVVIGQQFKWNVVGAGPDGKVGVYGVYPREFDAHWPADERGRAVRFRNVAGPAFIGPDERDDAISAYIALVNPLGKLFDPDLDPDGADDQWRGALDRSIEAEVGRPVEIKLMSRDVIHGFFLPDFRVKLDAIPGRVGTVRFTPTATGTYDVVCSNFCGLGHSAMGAKLVVKKRK